MKTATAPNKIARLVEEIRSAHAVVGCMAWVTDPDILEELQKKEVVKLVLHTEDFLDTDSQRGRWAAELLTAYRSFADVSHGPHHHKFLVFYKKTWRGVRPHKVWIGSIDLTASSRDRDDSAVVVTSSSLARQFVQQYCLVAARSTPVFGLNPQ